MQGPSRIVRTSSSGQRQRIVGAFIATNHSEHEADNLVFRQYVKGLIVMRRRRRTTSNSSYVEAVCLDQLRPCRCKWEKMSVAGIGLA